jgi:tetratricopeptide (TPR) repeat protein
LSSSVRPEAERKAFRETLEKYTASDAMPRGVTFHPVGWEDTLSGVGRAQGLINKDLKQCDYAVFVWHDRWGSPTGKRKMVGTEEERKLAEKLYKLGQVKRIAPFFKNVAKKQLRDPGVELTPVLAHKKRIIGEKRYLFKSYDHRGAFCDELHKHLAQWLREHDEKDPGGAAIGDLAVPSSPQVTPVVASPAVPEAPPPNFRFWIEETNRLLEAGAAGTATYSDALFCARKALASGASDLERAEAKHVLGICQFWLSKPADALATFAEITSEFDTASDTDRHTWQAKALIGKGATLFQLGRGEDAVAVYDDVIARFGAANELALRGQVAKALVNKGATLGRLSRGEDAIAAYNDVIANFGAANELALREQVAKALVNKGYTLGELGQNKEAVSVYDDVIANFGAASEFALREQVAKALVNKGSTLGRLSRGEDAIAAYDDVIARFGAASELVLRDQVAKALVGKGLTLGQLGRREEAIAAYDDVIARFGADDNPALKTIVEDAKRFRSRHGSRTESQ